MKNILVILMGMVFLISSSGYMMYKTNCSCTGEEQTTVFIRPETCDEDFHKHHNHGEVNNEIACSEDECHECTDHTKNCGCDAPQFLFFKLKDKVVNDDVKFVAEQSLEITVASSDIFENLCVGENDENTNSHHSDLPPKITSSLDFLINSSC